MKRFFNYAINLLPYIFIFISSLYIPTDPDLGWHLKYGEYFFKYHKILQDNIFSSTMTNYHWANGSWGTDLITYTIFIWGGFTGLIIASALIVVLTFYFFAKAAKFDLTEKLLFFPLIAYLEAGINSVSFRGQQISLLFFGVLIFLLCKYRYPSKGLWLIPLLFLFWSNLQIESFLGLGVLAIWIAVELYTQHKSIDKLERNHILLILFASFLVTFINPFGWNIHLVALSHIGDPLVQKIDEYMPFAIYSVHWWNQILSIILLFFAAVTVLFKKQFKAHASLLTVSLILLILAFFVKRYAWPSLYLLFPILNILWQVVEKYVRKFSFMLALDVTILTLAFIIYIKIPFTQFMTVSWDQTCSMRVVPCSSQSADFLIKHKLTSHIFTYYDWGGWLIWNYPQIKPSIDGRMHVWRDNQGYSASEEYDKYLNAQLDIDKSKYAVVYIPLDRSLPLYKELSTLAQKGKWKLVFDDGNSGVIVRQHQ